MTRHSFIIFCTLIAALSVLPSIAKADNECAIELAGSPRETAKQMLNMTAFHDSYDYTMFSDLGSIIAIKSFDEPSRGSLIMSTSKGTVVTFSPVKQMSIGQKAMNFYNPFTLYSEIVGLRPDIVPLYKTKSKKRAVVFTKKSAAVLVSLGHDVQLPTGVSGILNADFMPHDQVAVVLPKQIQIYTLPKSLGEPAVLTHDLLAQTKFQAAAIDKTRGRIVAADGNDLVVFNDEGQRNVIAHLQPNEGPVDKIIISDLGSRFYIRQGSRLTFYDFDGKTYGSVDVGRSLYGMDWNSDDSQIALSSPETTIVYNLLTQKAVQIGQPGDQWRRVAWSKRDGLLLTLGIDEHIDRANSQTVPVWSVDVWDPVDGKKLSTIYQTPLNAETDAYPYLVGLQGSIALGDFQFYLVSPDGVLSHITQGVRARDEQAPLVKRLQSSSTIIALPDEPSTKLGNKRRLN